MGSSEEGRVQNESVETSNSQLDPSLLRRIVVYLNNCNRPPGSMGQKKTGRKLLEGRVLTNTDESVEEYPSARTNGGESMVHVRILMYIHLMHSLGYVSFLFLTSTSVLYTETA